MNLRTVAALCVSGRSIYKHLPGVDAFDAGRDARTFAGGITVVAHPPCRCWSKYLRHQAKPLDARAEMELGLWCVRQVVEHGGVLEQPAGSGLFAAAGVPVPNVQGESPLLFSLYVEQGWFGYPMRKRTWVLVSGVPKAAVPAVPFNLSVAPSSPEGLSHFARSRTVDAFAEWLCQVARLTWWSLPVRQWCHSAGRVPVRPSARPNNRLAA